MPDDPSLLHATAVAIESVAVLLTGPSGSGKSDLALRLIDRGAMLISDDYVRLHAAGGHLIATAPQNIRGLIEVRGVGLVALPCVERAPVGLIVELDRAPERLPDARRRTLLGIDVPVVALPAFEVSAPIKVELALKQGHVALEKTTL